MTMTARSPDSQLFLKTHPNRMFRVGDDVYHTNRGPMSETPARGVVQQVSGAKRSGLVLVRWFREDGTYHSTTSVSAPNALEHLAVSIHNLQVPFHDFGGPQYVDKYFGFAMKLGDLKAGFALPTHKMMKEAITAAPEFVAGLRQDAKAREVIAATPVTAPAPMRAKSWKYIAVNKANGHQVGLDKQADLVNYPEGEYLVYSPIRTMKVVSEVKKSIVA